MVVFFLVNVVLHEFNETCGIAIWIHRANLANIIGETLFRRLKNNDEHTHGILIAVTYTLP